MDSENSIINEIKNFIPFINEEFLISLSNKGIYKRALKDLEKSKESIKLSAKEHEVINADFDDVSVELNLNIQNSKCSCPSSSVCKHIIMSLIYIKEYFDLNNKENIKENEPEKSLTEDYEELKSLNTEKALSLVGKKDFSSLINSITIKDESIFEYNDFLTVTLPEKNVKIYFPKQNSIQNSTCSCKEKGFCKHKAYAIMAYMIKENKIDNLDDIDTGISIGEKEEEFLNKIKEYICMVFDTGLSSLTDNEIKKTEKFYIQAYGMKFFNMASEIKNLSSEFNFYFSKNVSFSNSRTLHILCLIYNRASALLSSKNDAKKRNILAGQRKEDSFTLDNINLTGLGAICRITKRNDLLISCYFYCKEMKTILSMSTLRPMDNGNITVNYLYTAGILWADEYSFMKVSASNIILKEAHLTTGKISSAKSTVCSIKSSTHEEDIKDIAIYDYTELKDRISKKSFKYFEPYSETDNIFLIETKKIDNIHFDKVSQKLKFNVYDKSDNSIEFSIKYSSITETGIKFFENRKSQNDIFQYILGNITEKNNVISGTFLSGISNGKVKNIFFK